MSALTTRKPGVWVVVVVVVVGGRRGRSRWRAVWGWDEGIKSAID